MPLTTYGKRKIGEAMYHRGKNFLTASILLQQKGGYQYVVLHLLCQGIEIVLKAFLLISDFDKYRKLLRKYGHDLIALSKEASSAYGIRPMRESLRHELVKLNELYKNHILRYADAHDIFVDPKTIENARVVRRIVACIKLAERHFP